MGDVRMLLLNPRVTFPDGEWEAWDYASWYPGVYRYRSFRDMMEAMYGRAVDLSRH